MANDFFPFIEANRRLKESKLRKGLKQIEIAMRRGFIASLQFRSRFQKKITTPAFPLALTENPTILFLRQDKLGDAIISTPLLVALKKKYPAGHFIMLLGEKNKGIAELLPLDCEILIYKKRPLADIAMLWRLRKRKINVLIDLMDNPSSTSSILTAAISAIYSLGIEKENATSYNVIVPLLDRAQYHITRRLLELARPFGINPETVPLRAILKRNHVKKIEGKVGLVLSAGVLGRQILPETNIKIASGIIAKEYANEVMLFCDPKDRMMTESFVSQIHNPHVLLAPLAKSFGEYAAQLQTCEYVITPDTSAVHLCSAYEIPVVVMTNPFPPSLHYWTPIGVPYEMIVVEPSLASLEANRVIESLDMLIKKVKPHVQEAILQE